MVITRTPLCLPMFGDGTDYQCFYKSPENHSGVLAVAINKYAYLMCNSIPAFWGPQYRIAYSSMEVCRSIDEIKHPAARECLRHIGMPSSMGEVRYGGDIPARMGLNTASAYTVGLVNALTSLRGERLDTETLADHALYLEREVLSEPVPNHGQILCAYGGICRVVFTNTGSYEREAVPMPFVRRKAFESSLMMFYMGNEVTVKDPNAMYDWDSQVDSLNHSAKLSEEASAILKGQRDLSDIGYMLHESWELKKRLCNEVSTPKIDGVYSRAIDAGALGGKLTGAGGGGMLLLFVPTVKQDPVREALADMIEVPFKCDHLGSRVVYTDERTSSN